MMPAITVGTAVVAINAIMKNTNRTTIVRILSNDLPAVAQQISEAFDTDDGFSNFTVGEKILPNSMKFEKLVDYPRQMITSYNQDKDQSRNLEAALLHGHFDIAGPSRTIVLFKNDIQTNHLFSRMIHFEVEI